MKAKISAKQMAEMFDSTALHANITRTTRAVVPRCNKIRFQNCCCQSLGRSYLQEHLKNSSVGITTGISYPLGAHLLTEKISEVNQIAKEGPTDLDYVINISELKEKNYEYMEKEMAEITKACHEHNILCKVILETFYLTNEEITKMCEIAKRVKPDFIKTSTGQIEGGGATVEHVELISKTLEGSE